MRRVAFVFLLVASPAAAQTAPDLRVSVEGKLQTDLRVFAEGPDGEAPGFLVRRARAEVAVEAYGWLRLVAEGDLGEGEAELVDGYAEADAGRGWSVRVGRFKTPFGYESLRSSSSLRFAERSLATALSPRRDVGAMVHGAWGRAEVQAGLFNGVPDGASEQAGADRALDAVARVFAVPLASPRLGVGLAASVGTERGSAERPALADYETPGDRRVFAYADGVVADGARVRVGPQATLDAGPLHLLGEWTWARHRVAGPDGRADLSHHAWQAAASVVLVGEARGTEPPRPRRSVADGGPGALDVSARVHGLRLDADAHAAPESVRRATAVGVAVQWAPVAEARLGVTAERTVLGGGLAAAPAETLVVVRVALDF